MNQKRKLKGAKFALLDCDGRHIASGITDCDGQLVFDCLPLGKYFLRELEAPDGYEKCDDICQVTIDRHKCCKVVESVNVRRSGTIKIVKYGMDIPCSDH